jgi:hypothetical protein
LLLPQLQFHRRNHISQFTDMSQKVILAALERADSDPQLLDVPVTPLEKNIGQIFWGIHAFF